MEEEKLLPVGDEHPQQGVPSRKAQSWGTVISMIVIVLMIIIGAFYEWSHRFEQVPAPQQQQ
jgi:hypothetical protein